jgi:trypsin
VSRRLLLPAAVLLAVCLGSPAPAAAIVHGDLAIQGEFPAQGFLQISSTAPPEFDRFCGGTLIGSRQFLTAARCTRDDFGDVLPTANLVVRLGDVDRTPAAPDDYVVTNIEPAPGFGFATHRNDAAVLTLARVADYEPTRVVDPAEIDLWAPGATGTVLGWGKTSTSGTSSEFLRKVDVPIVGTSRCTTPYGATFDESVMLCAADPLGSPQPAHDSCIDDWGGPLLVPDGSGLFALAGIVSTRGSTCGDPQQPGIYTRMGAGALNTWVHDRTPEANFGFDHTPRANEPVTLTSTSHDPEGAGYFTTVRWDLDGDGRFDRAGQSVVHTFPTEGQQVVGIEASKPGGDKATAYFAFDVGPDPNPGSPASGTPPATTPPPPTTLTPAAPPLATISAAKRPKVHGGRFRIRISFARTAPRGTAIIEVFRGKRKIGIARTRVRRGATKRVSVKLTTTGTRLLGGSATRRLKVRVRVRVGRRTLRSKTLTIRR